MAARGVPELGEKIRARRKAASLTLKQLSGRSNISISMLSQIERGLTNPTFATVWRLTNALGIGLDSLLDRASAEAAVGESGSIEQLRSHMTPVVRSEDAGCTVRVLNPIKTALQVEWYEMRFQPRSVLRSDPHPPGAVENLTVLEGSVSVQSGSDRASAILGETLRYSADRPHSISNPTDKPAVAVVVVLYG